MEPNASQKYRLDAKAELKGYFDSFLDDATDAEQAALSEILRNRESAYTLLGVTPGEIPILWSFENAVQGTHLFRFPNECLPDVRAYDQWRQDGDHRLGVVKAIVELIDQRNWFGDVIREAARSWTQAGHSGITPESMQESMDEAIDNFEEWVETARVMNAHYADLVKQTGDK